MASTPRPRREAASTASRSIADQLDSRSDTDASDTEECVAPPRARKRVNSARSVLNGGHDNSNSDATPRPAKRARHSSSPSHMRNTNDRVVLDLSMSATPTPEPELDPAASSRGLKTSLSTISIATTESTLVEHGNWRKKDGNFVWACVDLDTFTPNHRDGIWWPGKVQLVDPHQFPGLPIN